MVRPVGMVRLTVVPVSRHMRRVLSTSESLLEVLSSVWAFFVLQCSFFRVSSYLIDLSLEPIVFPNNVAMQVRPSLQL